MYESARVRAPAICVVVVVAISCSVVLDMRLHMELRMVCSIRANCLYLFASSGGPGEVELPISTSSETEGGAG